MASHLQGQTRTRLARNFARRTEKEFTSTQSVCNVTQNCGWKVFRRGWSSSLRLSLQNKSNARRRRNRFYFRLHVRHGRALRLFEMDFRAEQKRSQNQIRQRQDDVKIPVHVTVVQQVMAVEP